MPTDRAEEAHAARWRLCLLGPPRLQRDDMGRELALRSKDAALLALVALQGTVPPDRVTALLCSASSG